MTDLKRFHFADPWYKLVWPSGCEFAINSSTLHPRTVCRALALQWLLATVYRGTPCVYEAGNGMLLTLEGQIKRDVSVRVTFANETSWLE